MLIKNIFTTCKSISCFAVNHTFLYCFCIKNIISRRHRQNHGHCKRSILVVAISMLEFAKKLLI